MNLFLLSLAPVLIIITYVYFRDKYDREPWRMLVRALMLGAIISIPVIYVERFLSQFTPSVILWSAAYSGFVVAGFSEESFKFLALLGLFWNNRNFNEKFDGIVYAVFISLGFAAVENILYVNNGGSGVGLTRAFTAVPAHALFGVLMGYHAGLARFYYRVRVLRLFLALSIPILLHGIYDFILMSGHPYLLFVFIPYVAFLWIFGFRRMHELSDRSIYRWIRR